jgi:Ca-activated chloride channel family protein
MKRSLLITAAMATLLSMGACGKPAVELTAPAEANAGSEITLTWTGTVTEGDRIVLRAVGETEGTEIEAVANSAVLTLPLEDGAYEIVYMNAEAKVIATRNITITPNTYTLDFPEDVMAGQWFEVEWTGPDNNTDYITIVPEGAPEGDWESYSYTESGSPVVLQAPLEAGVYEIRYSTEQVYPNPTLYSMTVTVISSDYAVMAPADAMAGSVFEVSWIGPDNPGDYITIVPVDTPEGEWAGYAYTSTGNPCLLTAPVEAGVYEVRYSSEQTIPNPTLAFTIIAVIPVEVTLSAPEAVTAGADFEVEWTGPDGNLDYITIVPAGSPEGTYTSYCYTSTGSPLTLSAPVEPGDYEIWYASDRVEGTFQSIPITVE